MYAFNQRIVAEEILRARRVEDRERYAVAQRQEWIDPNSRCILALGGSG